MELITYVDGSYNSNNHTYGGGVVVLVPGLENPLLQRVNGNDPNHARLRNVAGEIHAANTAVQLAKSINGCTKLTIHYDYEGIEKWITGEWKAKKTLTIGYVQVIREAMKLFDIEFVKVRAHSGNEYNELADRLAKEACKL